MEQINTGNTVYGTAHWQAANGSQADYGNNMVTTPGDYHVYAIEWDPDYIRWFVDGTQYHAMQITGGTGNTQAFAKDFFLLLNMAVGGNWPGFTIDDGALPAKMYVDYVRVYQKGAAPVSIQIEAESYATMSGVQTEACSEGGSDVGWIDANDWIVWNVNVPTAGTYTASYRVASLNGGGVIQLEKAGGSPVYGSVSVPKTGGLADVDDGVAPGDPGRGPAADRREGAGWRLQHQLAEAHALNDASCERGPRSGGAALFHFGGNKAARRFERSGRPQRRAAVVLRDGRHAFGQQHPGLLRRREDVDVGRKVVRRVERAHADEAQLRIAAVVAPQRDAAGRAARDALALAAVGRRVDEVGRPAQQLHAVGLDQRVERERRARLALAPAAVAAVHVHGPRMQPVAHGTAAATPIEGLVAHGEELRIGSMRRFSLNGPRTPQPAAPHCRRPPRC